MIMHVSCWFGSLEADEVKEVRSRTFPGVPVPSAATVTPCVTPVLGTGDPRLWARDGEGDGRGGCDAVDELGGGDGGAAERERGSGGHGPGAVRVDGGGPDGGAGGVGHGD